jgi:hypothetical protein
MISNCSHDENNRYSGGVAGDQNSEWVIRSWYNRPWDLILRYPDDKIREYIALLSEEAANNDKIGYDQGQRSTFWNQLTNCNYRPKNITVACETDCSSGVLTICKAIGYILDISKFKNIDQNGWTGSMRQQLSTIGFNVLTDKKYRTSDSYLLRGDILLNELHHTAINITNGVYSGQTNSQSNPVKNNAMQTAVYYDKTKSQGVRFNTTEDLYLKYGASATKYNSIMIMNKGSVCVWYGYYNIDPDTGRKWYYVSCGNKVGYASSYYLKQV